MSEEILKGGIFVSGPKASVIVYDRELVETVIKAICEATGDDSDDYTATDLDNPRIASGEELEAIEKAIELEIGKAFGEWNLQDLIAQSPTGQKPFIWNEDQTEELMEGFRQIQEIENMPKCYIEFESYRYVAREPNDDDSWDSGDDGYENTLIGMSSNPSHEYVPLCFNLVGGNEYYLVWVEYSTGDSFGSSGGRIEIVDLFISEHKARHCAAIIEATKADTFSFVRENGKTCHQNSPWYGYFEYLQDVHVDKLIWRG